MRFRNASGCQGLRYRKYSPVHMKMTSFLELSPFTRTSTNSLGCTSGLHRQNNGSCVLDAIASASHRCFAIRTNFVLEPQTHQPITYPSLGIFGILMMTLTSFRKGWGVESAMTSSIWPTQPSATISIRTCSKVDFPSQYDRMEAASLRRQMPRSIDISSWPGLVRR